MIFNSPKAEKLWREAIKDLIASSNKPGAVGFKERLDKVDVAITLAPRTTNIKELTGFAKVLRQQLEAAMKDKKGGLSKVEKSLKDLESNIVGSGLNNMTKYGAKIAKDERRKQILSEKKAQDEAFRDRKKLRAVINAQMAEVNERLAATPDSQALLAFQKDLTISLKALRNGDLATFLSLQGKRSNISGNYGVSKNTEGQLAAIADYVGARLEKRMAFRDRALGIADKIGYRGLNLGNAARFVSGTMNAAAYARRYTGSLMRGIGNVSSAARVSPDEKADKRIQDDLFQRQVGALEDIAKNQTKPSGSLLSSALALAGGLLKGGLLKTLMGLFTGKGLASAMMKLLPGLGLLKLAGLLTRLGPLAIAAAGGWYIGKKIYDTYAVEIQDGIEAVVNFYEKTVGYVTDGFEWIGDFLKDPMAKIKQVGGKLEKLWNQSIFAKIIRNPGEMLGAFASSLSASISRSYQATKKTVAPVLSAAKKTVMNMMPSANAAASMSSPSSSSMTPSGSVLSAAAKAYTTAPGVDMSGLQPGVRSNFENMVREYKSMGGTGDVRVNSAYRSNEKQAELHAQNPRLAAPPGKSSHNYGMAIDINRKEANEMSKMGLLDKYGFSRPVNGEPWHIQAKGSAAALSSKGIYSSDAPVAQSGKGVKSSNETARPIAETADSQTRAPSVSTNPERPGHGASGNRTLPGSTTKGSTEKIPMFSFADSGLFITNVRAMGN